MITVQCLLDQGFRACSVIGRQVIRSEALLRKTGKTDKVYHRCKRQGAKVDCNSHMFSLRESNEPLQILEHPKRDHLRTGNASTFVVGTKFKL